MPAPRPHAGRRSGRGAWTCALLVWSAAAVGLPSTAAARPVPLDPEEGCELYVGSASGNDPTAQVELRFCPEGAEVSGVLQWSSLRSGWNRRAVRGSWDGTGAELTLRDERIIEERPEPGWRFCRVDQYTLRREGDRLWGSYRSNACNDTATVDLRRVAIGPTPDQATDPASTEIGPPPSPPSVDPQGGQPANPTGMTTTPGPPPAAPPRAGESVTSGCGACTAPSRGRAPAPLDVFPMVAIAIAIRWWRRHRRARGLRARRGAEAEASAPRADAAAGPERCGSSPRRPHPP